MNKKVKCKVCGEPTSNRFNINFDATPICEDCANRVLLQQAQWLVKQAGVNDAYDRISHVAVEKQIFNLMQDFAERFYASDYLADRDAEIKIFLKERGFTSVDNKRYCKGCHADVTETMFCHCGEFPLNNESTVTDVDE